MHRYVALIANSAEQDPFDRLAVRFARRFADWRCAVDGRRAKAWVTGSHRSPIRFTSHGPSGCLIGIELGCRRREPWDGAPGVGLLPGSWGAYVAIQMGDGPNVTITRDPSGRIPCWTSRLAGADLYFSNIDDIPKADASSDPIDWDYIQYHLNSNGAYGSLTGLKAVRELLPGRKVQYAGNQGQESSAWPVADIIASPFESPIEAEAALRTATADAVGGWARRYDRIALDLSGGFDSSVVLGLIREQAPEARVLGINYLIAHPEGDERDYAQAAARQHGIQLLVEPVSAETSHFDLDQARYSLRPTGTVLPLVGLEARARAANTIDAQAAFTGSGGDHVFGENLPPSMLAEAVQDRLPLTALLSIAHDYAKTSSNTFWNLGWATFKELLGQKRGLKALLQTQNPYLTSECVEGVNFERFAHPDVLEVGERLSAAKLHQLINFHELNNHYVRYGPQITQDEVNPLQSQLVLEASLRIPSYWMNPAGRRRGLARRAFRDVVPEMILTRRGKGSSTSHVLQVLSNHKRFLRELMLDGHLVRRGLLDKRKLEIALSAQVSLKENFIGLPKTIVTEAWVTSNISNPIFSTTT